MHPHDGDPDRAAAILQRRRAAGPICIGIGIFVALLGGSMLANARSILSSPPLGGGASLAFGLFLIGVVVVLVGAGLIVVGLWLTRRGAAGSP